MKEKLNVKSPWGEYSPNSFLSMVAMFKDQLLHFQKTNSSAYLKEDIKGYDEILKSKSEKNAENFLFLKRRIKSVELDLDLKNNMEIVNYMKESKTWENPAP